MITFTSDINKCTKNDYFQNSMILFDVQKSDNKQETEGNFISGSMNSENLFRFVTSVKRTFSCGWFKVFRPSLLFLSIKCSCYQLGRTS